MNASLSLWRFPFHFSSPLTKEAYELFEPHKKPARLLELVKGDKEEGGREVMKGGTSPFLRKEPSFVLVKERPA